MLNVMWRRFDQSAKQLIVGHTTIRIVNCGHIARVDDDADAKMILTAPPPDKLEETTRASSYHMAEHRSARSESLQRHPEWYFSAKTLVSN